MQSLTDTVSVQSSNRSSETVSLPGVQVSYNPRKPEKMREWDVISFLLGCGREEERERREGGGQMNRDWVKR
jgi:hypothetical protein